MVGVLPAIKPARVAVFAKLTPMLAYCCMIGAIGEVSYMAEAADGVIADWYRSFTAMSASSSFTYARSSHLTFSVSSFGGVQAIPAFKAQFGTCTAAGVCALSTSTSAIVSRTLVCPS